MAVVAVAGTTSWGATLAWLLARNGHSVRLLCRTSDEAAAISSSRRAPRLTAVELTENVVATAEPAEALAGVDAALIVVPSQTVRENARVLREALAPGTLVVHGVKGLERDTGKRVSEMLLEELPQLDPRGVCALSGPNLQREIARGQPAATVVAGRDAAAVERAQRLLHSATFRVYASGDLVGVEMGGSLKNVVALAAGIAEGLGYGDNAKAGVITRALAEITRLGVAAGAEPLTFAGLAGVGDVMATCYSPLSRNHRAGERLARGETMREIAASSDGVIEGFSATAAACLLGARLGVELPIAEALRALLYEGAGIEELIRGLLQRHPTDERRALL